MRGFHQEVYWKQLVMIKCFIATLGILFKLSQRLELIGIETRIDLQPQNIWMTWLWKKIENCILTLRLVITEMEWALVRQIVNIAGHALSLIYPCFSFSINGPDRIFKWSLAQSCKSVETFYCRISHLIEFYSLSRICGLCPEYIAFLDLSYSCFMNMCLMC